MLKYFDASWVMGSGLRPKASSINKWSLHSSLSISDLGTKDKFMYVVLYVKTQNIEGYC